MSAFETSPRITPFFWFEANAEEAAAFYVSVFRNSRILGAVPGDGVPNAPSRVLTVTFELDGQRFVALNGGQAKAFSDAVSFVVRCDSQTEVDAYWAQLTVGGSEGRCGWLKDRFGVSWQIVPAKLPELIRHPKALQAMLGMQKIDLAALERAAAE